MRKDYWIWERKFGSPEITIVYNSQNDNFMIHGPTGIITLRLNELYGTIAALQDLQREVTAYIKGDKND